MKYILLIWIFVLVGKFTYGQCPPGYKCPRDGRSKECLPITDVSKRKMNILKNRPTGIPNGLARYWNIEHIIGYSDNDDARMYSEREYRYTEGYIVDYEEEGPESCNCYMASKSKKNGDLHIFLSTKPNAPKSKCIIVEITPDFKARYPEYKSLVVKKSKVRVFGYLMYDLDHRRNASMTCTGCTQVWRKTNWEIHPIVAIEPI